MTLDYEFEIQFWAQFYRKKNVFFQNKSEQKINKKIWAPSLIFFKEKKSEIFNQFLTLKNFAILDAIFIIGCLSAKSKECFETKVTHDSLFYDHF